MGKFSAVEQLEKFNPLHIGNLDLVAATLAWNKLRAEASKEQLEHMERHLLDQFRVTGTIGLTDGSGFTRATRTRRLLPVLRWMSGMKERIFSWGNVVGGRPIGEAITDNTEQLYPALSTPGVVALQMIGAQMDIADARVMPAGVVIDRGSYVVIGHNAFGFEVAEQIAEDIAGPGEVLLTAAAVAHLADSALPLTEVERGGHQLFLVDYGRHRLRPQLPPVTRGSFPAPYPEDLNAYVLHEVEAVEEEQRLQEKYGRPETVAVVKTDLPQRHRFFFDNLTDRTIVTTTLADLSVQLGVDLHERVDEDTVVSTRNNDMAVVEFARAATAMLTGMDYRTTSGVARGPIVDIGVTAYGEAVNVAAKITDERQWGQTLVHESVPISPRLHQQAEPFTMEKSGVSLRGSILR